MSVTAFGTVTASGLNLTPPQGGSTVVGKDAYTNGSGAGQAAIVTQNIQTISASSSVTLDLTAQTDVLGISVTFAKIKTLLFRLLNVSQDSVNGTDCSSVTVGAAASNPYLFGLGGTAPTNTINGGGQWEQDDPTAGGLGLAITTNKNVKFLNNDSVNGAALFIGFIGA
jgi:hypothetical protein